MGTVSVLDAMALLKIVTECFAILGSVVRRPIFMFYMRLMHGQRVR